MENLCHLSALLTEPGPSTFAISHHDKGSLHWMALELVEAIDKEGIKLQVHVTWRFLAV